MQREHHALRRRPRTPIPAHTGASPPTGRLQRHEARAVSHLAVLNVAPRSLLAGCAQRRALLRFPFRWFQSIAVGGPPTKPLPPPASPDRQPSPISAAAAPQPSEEASSLSLLPRRRLTLRREPCRRNRLPRSSRAMKCRQERADSLPCL